MSSKATLYHYRLIALPLLCVILFPFLGRSQSIQMTGNVVDNSTKNPLEGVSIIEKGTNNGTITNEKGNFSLTAQKGDSLVIRSLGYDPQHIAVGEEGHLAISLVSRSNSLTSVVVIGYGERQKKDVTGAISTISSKEIEKSTTMSPVMALQGNAAGVFIESGGGAPQARPTVRIRGVNTFGFADPLYVVDGIPIWESTQGDDLSSPVNIFTSVLKDASATAIYGVSASNGVILITTKKGKSGKPQVDFSARYGIQNIAKTILVLNTQQYMALVQEEYANNPDVNTTFVQKIGPLYDPASLEYLGNNPTYDWQKELLKKFGDWPCFLG